MDLDVLSYIQVYDVTLPDRFLDQLRSAYEHDMYPAKVDNNVLNTNARNCLIHAITDPYHKHIVHGIIDGVLKQYTAMFPALRVSKTHKDVYEFLKYTEGGHFHQHVDYSSLNTTRAVSISILLNDGFEGGDVAFFDGKHTVRLRKHQALLFPSNFMFPHCVQPVTQGERYVILGWVY